MPVTFRSRKAVTLASLAAAAASVLMVLEACTVTDPAGNKWEVGPSQRPAPGPTNGVVVGTFVGPDGKTYLLIDVNGDGVPDFAQGPDGVWRKITPPNQPYPTNPPSTQNSSSQSQFSPATPYNPWNVFWSGLTDWDAGIDPAMPFDFAGFSAGEWLDFYGMDVPAGQLAETEGLRLNLFDTTTMRADATFFSSSNFALPDIAAFNLEYEFSGLIGTSGDPDFLVLRVAGDFSEVVKFAFGIGDGVQTFSFLNDGASWKVVADENTGLVTLYKDGAYFIQMLVN